MSFTKITAVLMLAAALPAQTPKRAVTDAEVRRAHQRALLMDAHNDVTSRSVTGFETGKAANDGHTDIVRYRAGGFGAQFFAVYIAANGVEGNRGTYRAT